MREAQFRFSLKPGYDTDVSEVFCCLIGVIQMLFDRNV